MQKSARPFSQRLGEPDVLFAPPHPDYEQAYQRFWTELPHLLEANQGELVGQWVAYTPAGRLANLAADDDSALADECEQRHGCRPGHYVIARVVPPLPPVQLKQNWFAPAES